VRRAYLSGIDPLTDKDYEHRWQADEILGKAENQLYLREKSAFIFECF